MSIVASTEVPDRWMSRAEYYAWAEGRAGRFERLDGRVVAMGPERVRHTRIKGLVFRALAAAVEAAGLPCEVLIDGPTIEVGESDYEPDVIMRRGTEPLSGEGFAVPGAMVLVEVLLPTTRRIDVSRKQADYFQLPSVQHYLIVFSDLVRAIHHRRAGDRIETRILAEGDVVLEPPGISVPLAKFYPGDEAGRSA